MSDPRRLLEGGEASPALRALLTSAKRADDPSAAQIDALSARVTAAVAPHAPVPVPSQAVATALAAASRLAIAARAGAVIVGLGALCGAAWYVHTMRDDVRPRQDTQRATDSDAQQIPSAVVPRPPAVVAPDDAALDSVVPQPSPAPSPDRTIPPRPAAGSKPRGSASSEAETQLVVAAGAALVRDDAEAALALTRQHVAQFPNGAHAEERDRIAIEALARLGKLDRARAAADRFFLRYPRSIYRPRIEGLVR